MNAVLNLASIDAAGDKEMGTHQGRSKRGDMPAPGQQPKPEQITRARENAGLTQTAAADVVYTSPRTWQDWEQGRRPMHAASFELFLLKTDQSPLGRIVLSTIDHRGTYGVSIARPVLAPDEPPTLPPLKKR